MPHKGYKLTDEHKAKISKANRGITTRSGFHLSEAHKRKIGKANSIALKGKPLMGKHRMNVIKARNLRFGDQHPRWIKDRSLVEPHAARQSWVFAVKKRDNNACRMSSADCNGRLEVHHILRWSDYPDLRYAVNNGITLCHFHHPRGRSEESAMSPYFQEIIKDTI